METPPPTTSEEFDRTYRLPFTYWSDIRIPREINDLIQEKTPRSVLELGCGIGRLSQHFAQQGLNVTGVDFSPVAIAKAQENARRGKVSAKFLVGDVTCLNEITNPFDISFDVGCFHCLDARAQQKYASEVFRLLKPGGVHLIWALDSPPSGIPLSKTIISEIFTPSFDLRNAELSRRRLFRSHWYWLVRS